MNSVWEKINWSLNQEDVLKETLKLINAGADVNAKCEDGEPPLRKAIFHRHLKCAIQLIKAGADVNAKNKEGKTALMRALFNDSEKELLEQLIKAGADVNAKDKEGKTALMHISPLTEKESIEQLIKAGADVNAKDKEGKTALMYVAEEAYIWNYGARKEPFPILYKQSKCIEQLIKAGADVNAEDKEGKTALKCVLGRMGLVTTLLIGSDNRVAENLMDKIDQIEQLLKAGYRQTTLKNLVALRKEFSSNEMKKIIPDIKNRLKVRAIAVKRIERGRE